jgi:hypothetical protein
LQTVCGLGSASAFKIKRFSVGHVVANCDV